MNPHICKTKNPKFRKNHIIIYKYKNVDIGRLAESCFIIMDILFVLIYISLP